MSIVEAAFCRSRMWTWLARTKLLPWALQGQELAGEVLEIGGGSGAMAHALVQRWPHTHVMVTDYDPAMVDAAGARLAAYDKQVAVQTADASALPFPDESFDAVLSLLMLHHTLTWEQVLAEAGRVLRPGGKLIGYDLLDTAPSRWLHRLDRSPHRLIALPELVSALDQDHWDSHRTHRSLGGFLVTFTAHRR